MLILPIKEKWYQMILDREKKEEYRKISEYYIARLVRGLMDVPKGKENEVMESLRQGRTKDTYWVILRNGYNLLSPQIACEIRLSIGEGNISWGAVYGEEYFRLHICDISRVTVHKISNITYDNEIYKVESDGKTYSIHNLICDRAYEDGSVDIQTGCVCNQREYDEIKRYGYYYVYY